MRLSTTIPSMIVLKSAVPVTWTLEAPLKNGFVEALGLVLVWDASDGVGKVLSLRCSCILGKWIEAVEQILVERNEKG